VTDSRKIQANVRQLDSSQVEEEVNQRYGRQEISDACAVTIASWWQSPGRVGRHLATLASGLSVDLEDLLDDISATRRNAGTEWNRRSLDMLSTWAIAKDRRA